MASNSRSANPMEGWNAGFHDEDEEEAVETYQNTTEATLFLVEATETMLDTQQGAGLVARPGQASQSSLLNYKGRGGSTGGNASSKLELTLRAALAMMKRKVISCPKDLVGIVVFNTVQSTGTMEHCVLVSDLQKITTKSIRELTNKLHDIEDNPESVKTLFEPNSEQNHLANALGYCAALFRDKAPQKRINRRLMIVTDNDDPYFGSSQLARASNTKISDLKDYNDTIEGIFVPPVAGAEFDAEKFYGPLLTHGEEDMERWPHPATDLNAMLIAFIASLRTKEALKRTAFKIPFTLRGDFKIGICGYNLVGEEKKRPPTKVDLDSRTGREIVVQTVIHAADGKTPLEPAEVKKCFQIGKLKVEEGKHPTHIFFDENDVQKLKTLGLEKGLYLLGFKPRTLFRPLFGEQIKHAHFITPDEETYTGSTRTFAALWESMLKKEVVGFGVLVSRANSKPQIVIMMAQEEELDGGIQIRPPGIHVCQLPFADDMREHGLSSTNSVLNPMPEDADENTELPPQPAVDIAKRVVKKLTHDEYNPDNFPNPALNYHYECMAAFALEEDMPEPVDKTVPKYNTIHARAGPHLLELKAFIKQDAYDPSLVRTSNKVNKKRAADASPVPDEDLTDFVEAMKARGLKLTIPDLKAGLKAMHVKTSGRKDELYERAVAELEKRGLWEGEGSGEEDAKPRKHKKRAKVEEDSDMED